VAVIKGCASGTEVELCIISKLEENPQEIIVKTLKKCKKIEKYL
jgi:hypothetical protein